MLTITHNGVLTITAVRYSLTFAADRPFVLLQDPNGQPIAQLFLLSSVHPLHGRDDTTHIGPLSWTEADGEIVVSLTAGSAVWQEKIYRLRCRPDRFAYEMEVAGEGQLAEVHPFGGYYSGNLRWGSGYFRSGQFFRQGFNPEPNVSERHYFSAAEGSVIDLTGVPLPGRSNWFFTPPPFCFAFQTPDGNWLGVGVEAAAGENRFTEYHYAGQGHNFHLTLYEDGHSRLVEGGSFHLALQYEGHTRVRGRYQLPAIAFDFAATEYEALAAHVASLRAQHHVPAAAALPLDASPLPTTPIKPSWWRAPIFCGWGSQCHLATLEKGKPPDYARQSLYEQFLATLEGHQVYPGIVVLDDKWQKSYGGNEVDEAKWPDLAGFVARQHAAGRKVLLWLKAWDPEGIPAEECITNGAGLPIAVDPTHPAFRERFQATIRQLLSAGGYDADGFKVDFTARIPSGPGLRLYGELWGLELMKGYLGLIYQEAKRAKSDALVMVHTPHPYLADVLDMIRLNDMNRHKDISAAMKHRARIATLACPDALIDTDNWPITDRAIWRAYLPLQAELGVPSLYYSSHVDATGEPLELEDYQLIREVWAAYQAVSSQP
jgi:hypothetical protein